MPHYKLDSPSWLQVLLKETRGERPDNYDAVDDESLAIVNMGGHAQLPAQQEDARP